MFHICLHILQRFLGIIFQNIPVMIISFLISTFSNNFFSLSRSFFLSFFFMILQSPRKRAPEKVEKYRGKKRREDEQEKNESWLSGARLAPWSLSIQQGEFCLWGPWDTGMVMGHFPLMNARRAVGNAG